MGKIMLGGVEYTSTYNENKVEQIATDATTTAALPILLAKTGSSETVTEEVRKDPTLTYSPVGNNINFETGAGQNISPHLFLTTKANAGSGAQGDEECVVLQKNIDSNNSRTIYMHNGANSRGLTVQNKVSGSMTSKKLLTVNNSNQISSDCIVGEALNMVQTGDVSANIDRNTTGTGSSVSINYVRFGHVVVVNVGYIYPKQSGYSVICTGLPEAMYGSSTMISNNSYTCPIGILQGSTSLAWWWPGSAGTTPALGQLMYIAK